LLARPLDALVFLLPLILFYELMCLTRQNDRVIAFDLMRGFFELFGQVGMWAPGLGAIAILIATHAVSGEKWSIHWGRVGVMYVEAVALAIPLLALNWAIPLAGQGAYGPMLFDRLAMGVGAGIYEELVFRLILISMVMMIGVDLLRQQHTWVALAAVVLSALAFAAHHHPPIGVEPFLAMPFLFRCVAGVYLAIIFWYRGYGPAAGCHAAYNVALTCLNVGNG
jgi:membrane protease YdiL (CAAX protease family)